MIIKLSFQVFSTPANYMSPDNSQPVGFYLQAARVLILMLKEKVVFQTYHVNSRQ